MEKMMAGRTMEKTTEETAAEKMTEARTMEKTMEETATAAMTEETAAMAAAVPAANLPELPGTETLPKTSVKEILPAALPKTGQSRTNEVVFILSGMMLAAFAAGRRKREEEDDAE